MIDVAVIELASDGSPLPESLAAELASLQDAELVRLLDVAVLHKAPDGSLTVREASAAEGLGSLRDLVADPIGVLTVDEVDALAAEVRPGHSAVVVVWENTWADCLVAIAGDCGARLLADARFERRHGRPGRG